MTPGDILPSTVVARTLRSTISIKCFEIIYCTALFAIQSKQCRATFVSLHIC